MPDGRRNNTTPKRTKAQRLAALEIANKKRSERAELRRLVKTGEVRLDALLIDPPECVFGLKTKDFLKWERYIGNKWAKYYIETYDLPEKITRVRGKQALLRLFPAIRDMLNERYQVRKEKRQED